MIVANRAGHVEVLESRRCFSGEGLPVGMNLAAVSAFSEEWAFVDVFRHHTDWVSQVPGFSNPWNTGEEVVLDAQGYPILRPGQAAGTLMLRNLAGAYPSGRYVVTYEGDGDLAFGMDATVATRGDHRIQLDVTASDRGIYLRIDRSNPVDPVRNVHVWMPGFENAATPFHPLFLERLEPFSTLRFMDWQRTNNSTLASWEDRTTLDDRQSGEFGVAAELMIDLANELDADPWFCMPHLADDNFVRSFAELVYARLEPERRVYIEWSNEVWNTQFAQTQWAMAEAQARYGDAQEFTAVAAEEAQRDWSIWQDVFGVEADRVVRVAAGRVAAPAVTERLLSSLGGEFDVVAIAPYFSDRLMTPTAETTADDLLASALTHIETVVLPNVAANAALADQWSTVTGRHIPLVTYEGGQHFTALGRTVSWQSAYVEAQSHPLMYDAYARLLAGFQSAGGELFTAYSYVSAPNAWGSWGHLQRQDQPASEAPKWRALLDAIAGRLGDVQSEAAAVLVSLGPIQKGAKHLTFSILYSSDWTADTSCLATSQIVVSGPLGYELTAACVARQKDPATNDIVATYALVAPGGWWSYHDNGRYTIRLVRGDASDPALDEGILGTFDVAITVPLRVALAAATAP